MRIQLLLAITSVLLSTGWSLAQTAAPADSVPAALLAPVNNCPSAGGAIVSGDEPGGDYFECRGPSPRFWINADYLLWWIKDGPSRFPLLNGGKPASQGIPGAPGTTVLFRGSNFDYGTFLGIRLKTGLQDPSGTIGLEGGAFLLEHRATGFSTTADPIAGPLLVRPIIDANTGLPSSTAEHFLDRVPVTSFAAIITSRLWGGEANLTSTWLDNRSANVRLLLGLRYLDLYEQIDDDTIIVAIARFGSFTPGTVTDSVEQFHTRTQFYGGQAGFEGEWRWDRLSLKLLGKMALGVSHDVVLIQGIQHRTFPDNRELRDESSVLARSSNNGRSRSDRFAVLPEVGVDLSYDLTQSLRASVGYSFMYCSDVVRPGDQINPVVNLNQTGPAAPIPLFNHTDFWVQGINLGLAFHY